MKNTFFKALLSEIFGLHASTLLFLVINIVPLFNHSLENSLERGGGRVLWVFSTTAWQKNCLHTFGNKSPLNFSEQAELSITRVTNFVSGQILFAYKKAPKCDETNMAKQHLYVLYVMSIFGVIYVEYLAKRKVISLKSKFKWERAYQRHCYF